MTDISDEMRQEISEHNPNALVFDGHANAIIGMAVQHGSRPVILYDGLKIVDNLMLMGMTYDEAVEFFEFNMACAYHGEDTPMILIRLETMGDSNDADVEESDS